MVRASQQQLIEVRNLLVQAHEQIDAIDETFLGVVIDTALQEIITKIEASKTGE